ncbi:MAG TPA: chorismate synthase [Tenuifilaceae bacterium]|nr:chorismate synthase [Tenuifilaceae bacterium]HPE18879.1 chorismate synthase [Tenuifilaceae bacterium]HPJ46330.1 chorismate synthase [Tenuifilaceae bacterium]HPQ35027.1 chorismate synthase [Tenuifilaceae bacterium]HRX68350.1 chorismate synthase [Tenuifilaceae bacterium]
MNSFGRIFRITLFGESHGSAIGVTIDGIPAGISLSVNDFSTDLHRRKSGAMGTTPRVENDLPEIVSGLYKEHATGSPLTILFSNENSRANEYNHFTQTPRPGHADFVAQKKFGGFNDPRGGGHFSGRLTLALVAAGVVAKKIVSPVEISASLKEAGGSSNIEWAVEKVLEQNDSIGGIVECRANGIPVGWGEPFFDSVESVISHLAFAVPAIKGIEFGSGFESAKMLGSQHNDSILSASGKTGTNNAGGIVGGITNGNELVFRVAVKPTSSIGKKQKTYGFESGEMEELEIAGRHDACIALRVPVVMEAITAIALADFKLIHKSLT